jgi:broad specificity phosphatase PhoE
MAKGNAPFSVRARPDAPLSEAGAKAAGALITRLRDLAQDAVYSSPYERALDVGRPVGFVRLDALRPRRRRVEEM